MKWLEMFSSKSDKIDYIDQLKECKTEEEFKNLWDSDNFDWNYSNYLTTYCSKYFEIWWNSKKFNWYYSSRYLIEYCQNYRHIWIQDYMIKKLKDEL